jgi:acetyltransferase
VAKKKPLIVLKTARTEAGKRAVQSHTGALTGRDEVFSAAFKCCGLIQLSDFEEFEDTCKAFLYLPPMRGMGLGVFSYSGGGGIAVLDACHDYGLEVAELQPETVRKLGKLTPPWLRIGNLVDMGIAFTTYKGPFMDAFQRGLGILLADHGVHAVLIVGGALSPTPGQGDVWDISRPILAAAEKFSNKPIVCWLYGPYAQEAAQVLEEHGGVAVFPSCERAVRALAHQREYMERNP